MDKRQPQSQSPASASVTVSSNLNRQRGWLEPSFRNHRRRSHIAFAVALAVVVTLISLGQIAYAKFNQPLSGNDLWLTERLSHPQPDLSYWSPDFVREYFRISSRLGPGDYVIYDDFHGKWYNIDGGRRRTIGQPQAYDHTLWLFGNSSTFDIYVPDRYTYASQLQGLLNASKYNIRVMNAGASGTLISNEIVALRHTAILPGDTVLFLDGATDFNVPNPDVMHYQLQVEIARGSAKRAHAVFYHFVQPTEIPLPMQAIIVLPHSMYDYDGWHLNSFGDASLARALFDALTLI